MAKRTKETFKIYDLAQLQALPKPKQTFIIDPIIPTPGITILHGRWGTGKTAVLMEQAIAVAKGSNFLGLPTEQGNVLVIEADMPDPAFRDRFYDLVQRLDPKLPIKHVLTRGFNALSPTFKEEPLGQALVEINHDFVPALVIVDTLRKTYVGDEREGWVPAQVYDYWMDTFPDSAVQILAHDRKFVASKGPRAPHEEDFSGHQGWLNDAQSALHIIPTGKRTMRIEHTKSQVGEADMRLDIKLRDAGDGVELTSDRVGQVVGEVMQRMAGAPARDLDKEIARELGKSERMARMYRGAWEKRNV